MAATRRLIFPVLLRSSTVVGGALIWMGPVIRMAAQPVVMEPRMATEILMPLYRTWSPVSNLFDSLRWPEERVVW